MFSHTAIYGIAPQITKIASFFTLPIITKDLTALDYGVMGIITSYTAAIGIFSTLGLRLILVNSYYQSPMQYKWAWRQIYGFLMLWNVAYCGVLFILIYFVVPPEVADKRGAIIILSVLPIVCFGPVAELGSTYFQVVQRPWEIAIRSIMAGVLTLSLNVFFISHLKLGFMGWFWSAFFVGILSNLSYFFPMIFKYRFSPIFNFSIPTIKKYLKITMPVIPHYYSTYLLDNSNRVVMNLLHIQIGDIGRFNVANLFGNVVQSLGMASGLAIGPLMNEKFKNRDDEGARDLVFGLQVFFFLSTFLLCIWLKEFFQIMIKNAELSQMYPLGIVIIMAYNYRPMYFGANNALFFAEKTNLLWKVTFVAGAGNVVLNFVTVPIFGYGAAAFVTYASLMYMGYAGFYFRVSREINKANYYPLRWMVASVILTAAAYLLVEVNLIYKLLITLMSIIFVMALFFKNRHRYTTHG